MAHLTKSDDIKGVEFAGVGRVGGGYMGVGAPSSDGLALDLQFAADKTFTARKGPTPTFNRGSTGTFVGSDGLIQSAAINTPRFDHTSAGVCRGLLIEEARTNLALRSEDFGNATWNAGTATRTSDQIAAPDGASTADLITSIAGNFGGKLAQTLSFAATTYTASVFVKKGNWRYIGITLADISNSGRVAAFDFDTETVSANGVPSATIGFQKLSSGWYRIFLTLPTTPVTGTFDIWMTTSTGAVIGPIGSGQTVYAWGAQVEAGSFATSYIPTAATPLLRSADVCSISGDEFTGFYNQSEGTSYVASERISAGSSFAALARYSDNTNNNRINIGNAGNPHSIEFLIASSGTSTFSQSLNTTAFKKAALAYKANDANYAVNGSLGTQDNTVTVPSTVSQFDMGSGQIIAAIRFYKKRLSNAKLQALTV
jgi:hypothetical protein